MKRIQKKRWMQEIAKIEEMEKVLDYDPDKANQKFTVSMDTEELQILLDALATHKGVIRMKMEATKDE